MGNVSCSSFFVEKYQLKVQFYSKKFFSKKIFTICLS
jgi:hypothetical protein